MLVACQHSTSFREWLYVLTDYSGPCLNATPQPPLRGGEDALGLKPVYTGLVQLKNVVDAFRSVACGV